MRYRQVPVADVRAQQKPIGKNDCAAALPDLKAGTKMRAHRGLVFPVYVGPYFGAARIDGIGHELGHVREKFVSASFGCDENIT